MRFKRIFANPSSLVDALAKIWRFHFFYGWVIVGSGFVILLVTYGGQFSFNVFFPNLLREFGWQRRDLSGAFSLYTIVYSGFSPVVGRVVDAHGPRKTILFGGLLLFIGLGMMSQITRLWQIYFFLSIVAGLGMSTVFVTVNSTIVKWFIRRRGLALGIALCGNGVGIMTVPYLVSVLIPVLGWRFSYLCIALLVLLVMVWASRIMIGFPEEVGLRPDGDSAEMVNASLTSWDERFLRPGEASMTLVFWLLTLSFSANSFSLFFPFVHLTAFSLDAGFTEKASVVALSMIGGVNMGGRLIGGPLTSKIGGRSALMIALVIQAISWPFLFIQQNLWGLNIFALLFGVSYGWRVAILPSIIADYFGRAFTGSILGMIFCLEGFSAGLGVFVAGYVFDAVGSYDIWLGLATVGNLIGFLLAFALKSPQAFRQEGCFHSEKASA